MTQKSKMLPDFKNKIVLAPMEDVTEPPFRLICKRLGADVVYTEFISSEGLIRDARKAREKLFFYDGIASSSRLRQDSSQIIAPYDEDASSPECSGSSQIIGPNDSERPIGIQIFGGDEDVMKDAAEICESVNPDFIDINCGCWVKDVALRGAGAGLLNDLPKMKRIAQMVLNSVSLPVTLKTRLGWDENSIVIVDVAKMLEEIGIKALTVHCRVRSQGNKGEADWSWIKRIKDAGVKIPIILNGNIKTPDDVKFAFEEYQPDAVMIGQGAIANPWIFRQAKDIIAQNSLRQPTIEERIEVCIEHLRLNCELKGEKKGTLEFRKFYSGYLHGLPNASRLRMKLMGLVELERIAEELRGFGAHCLPRSQTPVWEHL